MVCDENATGRPALFVSKQNITVIMSVKGCVERLTGAGVGSILDYAVEEDIDENEAVELEMDACLSTEEHLAEIGDIPDAEMKVTEDKKV